MHNFSVMFLFNLQIKMLPIIFQTPYIFIMIRTQTVEYLKVYMEKQQHADHYTAH